jgi:integrase
LGERCENNVLERPFGGSKVFALRFRAYGRRRYLTLGTPEEGWTRRRSEEEMAVIRAEVERGAWVPPPPRHQAAVGDRGRGEDAAPFGSFAKSQVRERRGEVRPATSGYWDWALAHLLPFFADWPLTKIDVWAVDAYRLHKLEESDDRRRRLAEGRPRTDALGRPVPPLSAGSINKTIEVLRWLLSFAVEYGWIDDNPAAGKRRRIKVARTPPPHLESAGQIAAVLDAAAELDADPGWLIDDRLPVVATLVFCGLRVHELAALHWADLDFTTSTIHVRHSKTPAGIREVRMLSALRDCLLLHRDCCGRPDMRELVFTTTRGGPRTKDNVRLRILRPVLVRAEELIEARDQTSLARGITPHSLRHTFTSLLFAIGEDPVSVMRQLGHTDPAFTLRAYAHSMGRDVGERERLRALTEGDHGRAGGVAIGSEKNRHDAACGAEFVVGNSNRNSNRRPPGQRPGARLAEL